MVDQGEGVTEGRFGTGLAIRVLGPTKVERDGDVAAIGGPRQRAVLTRLVAAEGHLVTAEGLLEDVWGDDAAKIASGTLHSHLSLLRRALGDADLLRRDGPGYVLDVPARSVDARVFQDQVEQARAALATAPDEALALAQAALSLWRGPAYADAIENEWARSAAMRLDQLRLAATEIRFDALLATGRHTDAVAELERVVEEHPDHERFTAQLLIGLYRCGRQVDALAAFDRSRERLVEEFGLDPGPDLLRLQAAILDHEDWLAAPEPPGPTPPATPEVPNSQTSAATTEDTPAPAPDASARRGASATVAPPPALDPSTSPVRLPTPAARLRDRPFVGRAAELGVLREAWRRAREGERRFVALTGDAGAGKTLLISRFVSEAHEQGAIVMWGRATEEAIIPYEPVVEGLRTVLRTVSVEAQQRLVAGRDALALLVPDLPQLVPGVPIVRPEIGTERYVLFETLADLLETESEVWPIVFVLDDIHLADPLTLRLLDHVLHHDRRGRYLLVGTARTHPHTESAELDTFLAELDRDGMLDRIQLEGLAREEVAELLVAGGWATEGAGAGAIHRATGGNPFFVTELARHGSVDGTTLPESVRDVLGPRLDELDRRTMRIVSLAAVAGPVADIPVLARAGGFDGDEVLDAVDTAIAAGVLTEDGPSGSVTFPHALVQQAVLDRLTRSRRGHLHLQIADGLSESGDTTNAELAHHLINAGSLAPADAAVRAAVAAGRDALDALAYEEGDRWADRALNVSGPATTDELRCEALLLRSTAERALGRREEARAAALQAADAARAAGDPVLLARAAEALALARAVLGFSFGTEDTELNDLLEEAVRGLPAEALETRARLLTATLHKVTGHSDTTAMERLGRVVEQLPDTEEHPVLVATAHLAHRMAIWRLDLLDERLAADHAALEASRRAANVALELNALLYAFTDLTEAGDVDGATDTFLRFEQRAAEVRQPVYDAFSLFIRACIALLRGRYDASVELCEQGLEVGGESHGENAVQAWAGHVYVRSWDRGELPTLLDVVSGMQGPNGAPIWELATACCLVASGRGEEARPTLERLVPLDPAEAIFRGVRLDDNSLFLTSVGLLAELTRSLDDAERAAILHRTLAPYEGRIVVSGLGRVSIGPVARYAGIAAATAGDLDEAARLLGQSVESCRYMRAAPYLARSMWDLSLVLDRQGRHDEAAAAREEAGDLADHIGMRVGALEVAAPA